ncbi:MAG: hypothetical protein RLZZ450_1198 [Pseudomonadota bacterium]|jgi:hypothetical protein
MIPAGVEIFVALAPVDLRFGFDQRAKEPFGLAQRQAKRHAHRQRGLDRNARVDALTARAAARQLAPRPDGVLAQPHRDVATSGAG